MPVGDSQSSTLVSPDRNELGKGHDEFTLLVLCTHEDGNAAQLVMGESDDGDAFVGTQRGSGHGLTYPRFERKAQAFLEMAVP
ncbi:hypothetical protein LMG23994_05238 [Cupriavidus pinatubonensis]|uniref:Uncharacterized protein n=1 Tax=Cupriavidus pinatubonensis TaxID=248026 RepID=A0ABM8XTR6_9BURK|nr:hypothetical protein LMG23994_05238 [Cupriavidus pinatubonensis]